VQQQQWVATAEIELASAQTQRAELEARLQQTAADLAAVKAEYAAFRATVQEAQIARAQPAAEEQERLRRRVQELEAQTHDQRQPRTDLPRSQGEPDEDVRQQQEQLATLQVRAASEGGRAR
jgi:chromosome segregation ATPase